jgi:hypothetical protein
MCAPCACHGSRPWLALRTHASTYHYDDFDIEVPFHEWQYVLDEETLPIRALPAIGVAANNAYGATTVSTLYIGTGRVSKTHWNAEA